MSNGDELVVNANNGAEEQLKNRIIGEIQNSIDNASFELGEAPPPSQWEIWALGPFQSASAQPSRIIEINQTAYIVTVVFLNTFMNDNVTGFGGRIRLDYHTSNTQTMLPVLPPYSCCFEPGVEPSIELPFGSLYVIVREFTPTEAACLMETNICARVCNCKNEVVPGSAAFVRWVANFDFDLFFPRVGFQFDHPIRYLVYDNEDDTNCDCTNDC